MAEKTVIMRAKSRSSGQSRVQVVLSGVLVPGSTGLGDVMLSSIILAVPFCNKTTCVARKATAERTTN